jgi:hypothetical protein
MNETTARGPAEASSADSSDSRNYLIVPITSGVISVALLAFASIFLWRLGALRATKALGEQSFVKLSGLTLVITSGILLIVSGYSQNQIASMMGLLGTVAGYLLGKGKGDAEHENSRAQVGQPSP